MSTNSLSKGQSYFEFIDVLRFLTILISFLHHSQIIYFVYGHTFFFVLSGFILTFQAKNEYKKNHFFNIGNFTMRRILRIFPLYFLIVFFSFAILPLLSMNSINLPPITYYLTLCSNYYTEPHIFILMILWSVPVQEQFYLFISICYKFFFKYLQLIAFAMIFISIIYKAIAEYYHVNVYTHTLNHFSSFGIGILFALLFLNYKIVLKTKLFTIILLSISISFLFFCSKIDFPYWYLIDNTVVSLFFGIIILFICKIEFSHSKNKILIFFERLGQFSYGLYCYQGLAITFGNLLLISYLKISNVYLITSFNFILLITTAFLSYNLFEKPILKLKKYFR